MTHSTATAKQLFKCSIEQYQTLIALIDPAESVSAIHGFDIDWHDGDAFMYADESFELENLPKPFLAELGRVLLDAGQYWLEFGWASNNEQDIVDSVNGGTFRIYADGTYEYAKPQWSREPLHDHRGQRVLAHVSHLATYRFP